MLRYRALLLTALLGAQPAFAQADAVRRYVEKRASFEISMEQLNNALIAWDSLVEARPEPKDAGAYGWQNFEFHHGMDLAYLAELQADLENLLGNHPPAGFLPQPGINLETLAVHIGHPQINGLRYESAAGDAELVVSSTGLLKDWQPLGLSRTLAETFDGPQASPTLYDAALEEVGVASVAARLPVTSSAAGQRASALLVAWPYRIDPWPTHVAIAAIQGDRLYVGRQRLRTAMPVFSQCMPRYRQLSVRGKYAAANEAFQACYAKAVSRHPALLQATQQAQAFLVLVSAPPAPAPESGKGGQSRP